MQINCSPEYLKEQGFSPTLPERFFSKVNKDGPIPEHMPHLGKCWVWTACRFTNGYGWISASKKPGDKTYGRPAHVTSWIIHNGPIPKGQCVCHHCDNKLCVAPHHLFLGTKKENTDNMMSKGRYVLGAHYKGEQNGSAKLTSSQVLKIRELRKLGNTLQAIGLQFGVSHQTVRFIVIRKTWTHI